MSAAGEPNWRPLEVLADTAAGTMRLDPDDFMWTGRVTAASGVELELYKHHQTRDPPGEIAASRPLSEIKAELFKALAHPGRIRVLEILRDGGRTVSELVPLVGLEASHLSHQLAVLRRARVVNHSREGSTITYTIADPEIVELLAVARQFLINSLTVNHELLADLRSGVR